MADEKLMCQLQLVSTLRSNSQKRGTVVCVEDIHTQVKQRLMAGSQACLVEEVFRGHVDWVWIGYGGEYSSERDDAVMLEKARSQTR